MSGRGLRLGDPVPPYLFLLCGEGFLAMLNKVEDNGLLKGIKLAPTAPRVNHLLFVDDSLFF